MWHSIILKLNDTQTILQNKYQHKKHICFLKNCKMFFYFINHFCSIIIFLYFCEITQVTI